MSHDSESVKDFSYSKNKPHKKTSLVLKITACFIVGLIAIVVPSIAISAMYESLEEVNSSSEIITDSLIIPSIPDKIPSLSEGISETKKSLTHMSSIFSNFIQRP
ncbi:MAG: hypothetical protein IH780_00495 [Thaumarchaeota archaeon]|nr:hypothetical protein [Nitrososphaerota archaeon]